MGDYQNMNDNGMPAGGLEEYWETPQTLNTTWGYSKFDQQWKSARTSSTDWSRSSARAATTCSTSGRQATGRSAADLGGARQVGAWMQKNGESIYGTSARLLGFPWGRCTMKDQKVYLHVFSWPADGVLRVSGLNNEVRRRACWPRRAKRWDLRNRAATSW